MNRIYSGPDRHLAYSLDIASTVDAHGAVA